MKKLNAKTAQYPIKRRFRLFQGILPWKRATIGNDIMAGIVLAAIGIPEVMGYTKIAGTPIATGLYTLLLPVIVFAIFGSSLTVLATIKLCERFMPKFPGALLAVIVAIIVSWLFDFTSLGISTVGTIPSGLPSLALPTVDLSQIPQVLKIAFSCCIVIIAQSAATSRAYAFRYCENFRENADLEGLAAANFAAGLTGTFVVNGSPTKTEIVDTAGRRSQVAQLSTVIVVLVVTLFLTQPISYLPNTVLAAIVFSIGLRLIDIKGAIAIYKTHLEEFYLAVVTTGTVVFVGVEQGILLAIVLSLILHVRHGYRPHSAIIIPGSDNFWQPIPVQMGRRSSRPS